MQFCYTFNFLNAGQRKQGINMILGSTQSNQHAFYTKNSILYNLLHPISTSTTSSHDQILPGGWVNHLLPGILPCSRTYLVPIDVNQMFAVLEEHMHDEL